MVSKASGPLGAIAHTPQGKRKKPTRGKPGGAKKVPCDLKTSVSLRVVIDFMPEISSPNAVPVSVLQSRDLRDGQNGQKGRHRHSEVQSVRAKLPGNPALSLSVDALC